VIVAGAVGGVIVARAVGVVSTSPPAM